MITIDKLKIHVKWRGDGDAWTRSGAKTLTYGEWLMIDGLLQDWDIIKNNLASEEFILVFNRKLADNFDDVDTIKYFKSIKNV